MHVPNPLGKIALTLRDSDIANPRPGELLLDYTNLDLIVTDKETQTKKKLAESIYKQIVDAKVENTKINIVQDGTSVEDVPTIPEVKDRKMNNWYMSITSAVVKDPNENGYSTDLIATWNSKSDVDNFFKTYNHYNYYSTNETTLKLGNRIKINDGTYNAEWMIAGFDVENGTKIIDSINYDNGYGIALIPVGTLGNHYWGFNHYSSNVTGINIQDLFWNWNKFGYNLSDIHILLNGLSSADQTYITSNAATRTNDDRSQYNSMLLTAGKTKKALQTVLGTHLIERKVLLSGGRNSVTNTSTTAYVTLMSACQTAGPGDSTISDYYGTYMDGEANYKLPVFNYTSLNIDSNYWIRNYFDTAYACIALSTSMKETYGVNIGHIATYGEYEDNNGNPWYMAPSAQSNYGIRPMIYVR